MEVNPELVVLFQKPSQWREWLEKNHASAAEVWVRYYKKNSDKPSISYAQALDEALCFGWIDGISKSEGEESYVQRFTPRRAKSIWSKRNIEHVTRLIEEGKMTPAGQKQIDAAQQDGRWEQAYDSPANTTVPDDLASELAKHPAAQQFFQTLNKTNTYAIIWRLQTAKKPETRQKRLKQLVAMLERGEKIH